MVPRRRRVNRRRIKVRKTISKVRWTRRGVPYRKICYTVKYGRRRMTRCRLVRVASRRRRVNRRRVRVRRTRRGRNKRRRGYRYRISRWRKRRRRRSRRPRYRVRKRCRYVKFRFSGIRKICRSVYYCY